MLHVREASVHEVGHCFKKRLLYNILRYCHSICLEGQEIHEYFSHITQSPGQGSNFECLTYEAEMVTILIM
jgi:hypothetical protein